MSRRHDPHPGEDVGVEAGQRRILGIDFFTGTVTAAVERMLRGGLLVVPAAPALLDLESSPGYRDALLQADLVIPDSAYMVLIWNLLERDDVPRISGLKYLRELLQVRSVREPGRTFWIMAGRQSSDRNLEWLASQGIHVPEDAVYLAPMYGPEIADEALLATLRQQRPSHIIVTIGGGTQERLGLYLKNSLDYRPGIHCIGAAIAFLSGDHVGIPAWADRLYLGWLFRSISEPRRYMPRYWKARKLFSLILRYRAALPKFTGQKTP